MRRTVGCVVAAVAGALTLLFPVTGTALASTGTTDAGVTPSAHPGNFVASDDDQVCYELVRLGLLHAVTSEMRGLKVDPPADHTQDGVTVTIRSGGTRLDWSAPDGATMLGIVVKGGPNFHVYNYVGTGLAQDGGLHSPLHRRSVPEVSHYNVCYSVRPHGGHHGCTPGYWRNHADRWQGVAPSHDFDHTFGVDAFQPDISLGQAISLNGDGLHALARHAAAALLNAHGGVPNVDGTIVNYPYTPAQVIDMVRAALHDGTVEATTGALARANELGCPLTGTSLHPVH